MTVEQLYENGQLVDAKQRKVDLTDPLALAMMLNNDGKFTDDGLAGDPTEATLIQYYLDQEMNRLLRLISSNKRVAEIPFDSERKLMSTFNEDQDGKVTLYTKGSRPVIKAS